MKLLKFLVLVFLFVGGFMLSGFQIQAADIMEDCVSHPDCSEGSCGGNACFCSPTLIPPGAPSKCVLKYGASSPCTASYECISGQCTSGTCQEGGAGLNSACGGDTDCNIGACTGGQCICGARGVCEAKPSTAATTGPVEWTSPIGAISPTQLIGKAIKAVLGILGAVALFIFVYGGFVWMTSGGSPEKIKTARTTLVWAVLGMAVIFLSYAAVDFVLKAFGV
jgi:hypothetical protein